MAPTCWCARWTRRWRAAAGRSRRRSRCLPDGKRDRFVMIRSPRGCPDAGRAGPPDREIGAFTPGGVVGAGGRQDLPPAFPLPAGGIDKPGERDAMTRKILIVEDD